METLVIPEIDKQAEVICRKEMDFLAKVPGSLGCLETLAVRLAGMTGNPKPLFPQKGVVLFAADHAITLNGLSATGQEVTVMQVRNFLKGGGTINAFSRNAGASLTVVDVGVGIDIEDAPGLVRRKVMYGAEDFSRGPAMSREQAAACVQVGIDMAREQAAQGISLLAAGEMGIGNTSPSSAVASIMTGASVDMVTGMGSGISSDKIKFKAELIQKGIELNKPDKNDGLDVLAKVGGPELGAMAGLMLGGASLRIPVVVDGFIAGAAAAIAQAINPGVCSYLVGSHVSFEPGHLMLMKHINVDTYFDFGLRLGEGTGAALMFPIIDAAVRILSEMKTMADIGIVRTSC